MHGMTVEEKYKMDENQKQKLFDYLHKSVSSISNSEIEMLSSSDYEDSNVKGMNIVVKVKETDFPFFVGLSVDEKYADKLIFGILAANRNENINKVSFEEEDNAGNGFYELNKLDEKFFSKEELEQTESLADWIQSQMSFFASNYRKENADYGNISLAKWLLIVELPWAFLIGAACICGYLENAGTKIPTILYYAIVGISILSILLTLGFKNRIRKARDVQWNWLNPWTWFTSYIAKVLFSVPLCPIMLIPHIPMILKFILKMLKGILTILRKIFMICLPFLKIIISEAARGASYHVHNPSSNGSSLSSLSSLSNSSGGNRQSSSGTGPKLQWYICKKCGTCIKKDRTPSASGCPSDTFHLWTKTAEVGETAYCCKCCGITIYAKFQPSASGCPNETFHSWTKL